MEPWIISIVIPIVVGLWAWLAVKVIGLGVQVAEMQARLNAQEKVSQDLVIWLRSNDAKLDTVAENTAKILGALDI